MEFDVASCGAVDAPLVAGLLEGVFFCYQDIKEVSWSVMYQPLPVMSEYGASVNHTLQMNTGYDIKLNTCHHSSVYLRMI